MSCLSCRATHCNTLQHIAPHYNTLHHTMLEQPATSCRRVLTFKEGPSLPIFRGCVGCRRGSPLAPKTRPKRIRYVAVCCSVCCSVLQRVDDRLGSLSAPRIRPTRIKCIAVFCSALQCVAVRCGECCSLLQRVNNRRATLLAPKVRLTRIGCVLQCVFQYV